MGNLKYLLDTNILSEPIRQRPHPQVLRRFDSSRDELATATVVWHELLFGCYRLPASHKRRLIETYLFTVIKPFFPILPYSQAAAEWHAAERARLTAIGKTPAFVDGQIAAIAKTHELILVTANVSDYQGFAGLTIENWFLS